MKYYSLARILQYNAKYNVIFGERSNGKTYSVLEHGIKKYCKSGEQMAIVRRWQDDFIGKRGQQMFSACAENGLIKKYTKGEYTDVYYHASKWYFCRYEDDEKGKRNRITSEDPFCYGFAISSQEHDKSTSYPRITTILFDEFITRSYYLPDEFVLFTNVLSTIIRQRDDVQIFMLGNTVNKYCPYFSEMGLSHVSKMNQGDIDLYKYGESGLTVAVEFTSGTKKGKKSDVYFAFDNPKLKMITEGQWELDIYPHCPLKYRPCETAFIFFIIFNSQIMQCNVIVTNDGYFLFIHEKTTELKNPDTDLIYTADYCSYKANIRQSFLKSQDKLDLKIAKFFREKRVFYSNNEIGDVIANYLKNCA